jgi:rod shape determining protein RodA
MIILPNKQYDIRYLTHFDWISFILVMLISIIGLLTLYSAAFEQPFFNTFFIKQAYGIAIGFILYCIFCCINPARLESIFAIGYFVLIGLLMLTLIKGSISMGGQRWFSIIGLRFQPSEIAKLALPAFITFFLSTERTRPFPSQAFYPLLAIIVCSALLIMKQPDLGTAIIISLSGIILLCIAGMKKKLLFTLIIFFGISSPIAWYFLHPYQQNRIRVYLGAGDIRKERYQIEQSIVSVGSGEISGKGFCKGTQNKYAFLPARRTDFIFSVFAEEYGFVGCIIVLLLYGLLFIRIMYLSTKLHNPFERLLMLGLLIPIILSALCNISMVVGLAPIVGIPLPLMSYGLSNMLITFAALGWINGIYTRRFITLPLPHHLDYLYNENKKKLF